MKTLHVPMLVLAGIAATPALAQTADEAPFSGPRVEGFGGYVRTLPDRKTIGANTTSSGTPKHNGGTGGALLGYDLPLGPVVVGGFGSFAEETSNGCGTLGGTNVGCLRPGRQIEGGARVGYVFGGRFMAYAKGSYVNTAVRTTTLSGAGVLNSHKNVDGWRTGGGVEFALNPHVYLKAEYDYGRTNRFSAVPYGFQNTSVSYHQQYGLGGVGFRF